MLLAYLNFGWRQIIGKFCYYFICEWGKEKISYLSEVTGVSMEKVALTADSLLDV